MKDGTQRSDKPMDELTEIANEIGEMARKSKRLPEGCRMVVMVDSDDAGGIGMFGYDAPDQDGQVKLAATDIIVHLTAILDTAGVGLDIIAAPVRGQG